jgi:hypothetical protein
MNRTARELNLSKDWRASREHLQICHRDASVSGNCNKIRQCGCRASLNRPRRGMISINALPAHLLAGLNL